MNRQTLKKAAVVVLSAFATLAVAAIAFGVWTLSATRTRPWHLDGRLDTLLSECRVPDGAAIGYERLVGSAAEARKALRREDENWSFRRDYTGCVQLLLSACLEAQRMRLELAARAHDRKVVSGALIASIRNELGDEVRNGVARPELELRLVERNRARILLRQSEQLASHGETDASIRHSLRALTAWRQFGDQGRLELARFRDPERLRTWEGQASAVLRWTRATGRRAILVDKLDHSCQLLAAGEVERFYPAELGRNWFRQKIREQDASTPEGEYRIRRKIPAGQYGRALAFDYPNSADWGRFRALKQQGTIGPGARIGGNLEIHGGGGRGMDWTDGCVSLTDHAMAELYRFAYVGMPVVIVGSSSRISKAREP